MNDILRPITEDGNVGFDKYDQLVCWVQRGESRVGTMIKDVRELTCCICNHGWEATAEGMSDQQHWQLTDSWVHLTCLIRHTGLNERSEFQRAMIDARTVDVGIRFESTDIPNRYWGNGDLYGAKPWYQFDLLDFPVRFIIGSRKRVVVVQVEPLGSPPVPPDAFEKGIYAPYIPKILFWWKEAEAAFADEDVTKEFGPERVMLHAWGKDKLKEYVAKLAWFAEGRTRGDQIRLTKAEFDALVRGKPWKAVLGDRWKNIVHSALWDDPHVEEWIMGEFVDPEGCTSTHTSVGGEKLGIRWTRIVIQ